MQPTVRRARRTADTQRCAHRERAARWGRPRQSTHRDSLKLQDVAKRSAAPISARRAVMGGRARAERRSRPGASPPPDRPREPPAAGHIVRELLGQFRALLPSGRALVVEADHSPRISLKPAVSFCAVNRSGHNRPAPAKNAGFGGALRVAKGIIQWVTWNLARFASRSIPSFASSSAAPPSRPTRGCCFRASWTRASA